MSEFGLKIQNIKAATLYEVNLGLREYYDSTAAMFCNSLFSDFIRKHGLRDYLDESTRDIVCFDFGFGTRSYEDELKEVEKMTAKLNEDDEDYEVQKARVEERRARVERNKDKYHKLSKAELRREFYENGVDITYKYKHTDKETGEIKEEVTEVIHYKMLYRNPSKAKTGQVMFINEKLYDVAYDWLTMGIGKKMPDGEAKIVEISAYAPLSTSTIEDKLHILVKDVLILKDQDSFFETAAAVVEAEEYTVTQRQLVREYEAVYQSGNRQGQTYIKREYEDVDVPVKKCVVKNVDKYQVMNTIWDGMALIDSGQCGPNINGMALLRNHFFKACAFKTNIQQFFKDWCEKNGKDYETYFVTDIFGVRHQLKNIKIITTDNAIKWKKFKDLMSDDGSLKGAYKYWCKRVKADGQYWGVVKTDHPSKLGSVQQMSYQMVNTLPCNEEDVMQITDTSRKYVEDLKNNPEVFKEYLIENATEINNYEMIAVLQERCPDIVYSDWYKEEKKSILKNYTNKLRKGKITVNADNMTMCGNPYALLLYSVKEDWENDPTLQQEEGTIQCYSKRFDDGEYLCAFRNPHNSANNVCYFHNRKSELMEKYFEFSDNIVAVNCIHTDIQCRANGMDFDSDFMYITNNEVLVRCAKECYEDYPTVVNNLNESGVTYHNTLAAYAEMDNKLAKAQLDIGESSNLAQLAVSYYWSKINKFKQLADKENKTEKDIKELNSLPRIIKELNDNFVILAVLAQVAIDGCKREYEVNTRDEINRIKNMSCMLTKHKVKDKEDTFVYSLDFPAFMKYTKHIKTTKNGKPRANSDIVEDKHKITDRINYSLVCPMNYLESALDKIHEANKTSIIPIERFLTTCPYNNINESNKYQTGAVLKLVKEYTLFVARFFKSNNIEENYDVLIEETRKVVDKLKRMNFNKKTMAYMVHAALGSENGYTARVGKRYREYLRNRRKMLNLLYKSQTAIFLSNFRMEIAPQLDEVPETPVK